MTQPSPIPPGDDPDGPLESWSGSDLRRVRSGVVAGALTALVALAACGSGSEFATTTTVEVPATTAATAADPAYLDPSVPVDERVEDLLGRMTLDEKLGQMTLVEKGSISPEEVREYAIGALLSGGGGTPRPNNPEAWREMVGAIQDAALATRLGIPVIYGVDAVHGHNNLRGATIFPHNVGLGATRDPVLVEEIARATAEETAATGIRWNYSPVLAVPQDVRWGRTYEAFGEDPELVSLLGAAVVRGLQGADLAEDTAVVATPKHFVGDGGTGWGTSTVYRIDQGVTLAGEDELRSVHVYPYLAAFETGAVTVMASYSSWENGKVHGDRYLLTDMLRGELGFDGFVVSDWAAVDQVKPGDLYGSIVQSVNAGIDMVMVPSAYELFIRALRGAVTQGDVIEERIDEAVRRILRVKFAMGLFESPMPTSDLLASVGSDEHRALARRAVARSMVLLETDGETLPIDTDGGTVLLGGAAAHDVGIQSGGWTISWQGDSGDVAGGTSIFDALTAVSSTIEYDRFGKFDNRTDVAPLGIAVVGERPYAEGRGDSESLMLPGSEVGVIRRMRPKVDKLVVVLITGRPLVLGPEFDSADALVVAWLPGSEGAGIVDVLTGEEAFAGVLPYTWPSSIEALGSLQMGSCDGARYPFGYGLSTDGEPLGTVGRCDS